MCRVFLQLSLPSELVRYYVAGEQCTVIDFVFVVTVSWKSSEVKAHENQSSVTVCANAEGWTTSDKTLIIPIILVQSHTATSGWCTSCSCVVHFVIFSLICFRG